MLVTKEELEKINKQLYQIRNISIILTTMLKPIQQTMSEHNCTQEEAIDRKQKAYDFIKKYATNNLDNAVKEIKEIINT